MYPPSFKGKPDPTTIEMWIIDIKKDFDTLEIPMVHRVSFASLISKMVASYWWDTNGHCHNASNMM